MIKKYLLLILCIVVLTMKNVKALEVGDTINREENYDSSTMIAGNEINDKSTTNGIKLIAGNEITLEGITNYGMYAGNIIHVDEEVEKDLFIAGNKIQIDKNANIGRDIYIAGNQITIDSNINRNINLIGDTVILKNITINGNAYIIANKIILDEETIIKGKLTYTSEIVKGLNQKNIGEIKKENRVKKIKKNHLSNVKQLIVSILSSFLVAAVLFLILPNTKNKLDNINLEIKTILKHLVIGVTILIMIPILSILLMFTGIFTPISLITLAIYIISIYLSELLVDYMIGSLLTKKLLNKENKYLSLLIGITLIKIVKLIPKVKGIITTIILLYGMGLIYHDIKKTINKNDVNPI